MGMTAISPLPTEMCGNPGLDVRHHDVLVDVVEQIVKVAVVQLEGCVVRTGQVVEALAPARLRRLIVPCRISTGNMIDGNSFRSRSSARTISAIVLVGCVS